MSETSSSNPSSPLAEEFVLLAQIIRFGRRYWRRIAIPALVAGLAAFVVAATLVEPTYEASATLAVLPAGISSTLKPSVLSERGYQRLLESDAVLAETSKRLWQQGALAANTYLTLDRDLSSRIFVSRSEDTQSLAPMIELVGHGKTPEQAAAIANTWAEVLLENVHKLVGEATGAAVRFVEEQYPETQSTLHQSEAEAASRDAAFRETHDQREIHWARAIAAANAETERKVTAYQAKTRALLEERVRSFGAGSESGRGPAGVDLQGEVGLKLWQLVTVRVRLAQTRQMLEVVKDVPDEALWQNLVDTETPEKLNRLSQLKFVAQELNPVYDELVLRAVELETEIRGLARGHDAAIVELSLDLERLQRERGAGLEELRTRRATEVRDLELQRARDLAKLDREHANLQAELGRRLRQLRNLEIGLADNHNQAVLAKAQESVAEIYLAAPAVPIPNAPTKSVLPQVLLVAFVAGLLGAFSGVVSEVKRDALG